MSVALAIAAGLAYLAATVVCAKTQTGTADKILRDLSVHCPDAWADVGAPLTVQAAVRDPDRRWERFVRERAYLSRCDTDLARRIDAFRRRSLLTFTSIAIVGAVVLYCLWQVELPSGSPRDSRPCLSVEERPCADLV
ncbi:MAG: hypothetical protein E4H03_00260 [Myxococcales bacterium]|nr:MAG: hypothetical protein E4H03_00260 [Myxococcales bacterium]